MAALALDGSDMSHEEGRMGEMGEGGGMLL